MFFFCLKNLITLVIDSVKHYNTNVIWTTQKRTLLKVKLLSIVCLCERCNKIYSPLFRVSYQRVKRDLIIKTTGSPSVFCLSPACISRNVIARRLIFSQTISVVAIKNTINKIKLKFKGALNKERDFCLFTLSVVQNLSCASPTRTYTVYFCIIILIRH